MGAPTGNQNALGNRGGKPYSAENREKAATFKGLVLDECLRIMREGSLSQKRDLMMRTIASCLPRETAFQVEPGTLPIPILHFVRGEESSIHTSSLA